MSDRSRPKSRGISPVLRPTSPLLSELAGMRELRAWGEAFATDMLAYKDGTISWNDVDPGVVIHGPPGTGKSTFARALAASTKLPLIAASYAHWQRNCEGHMGDVLRAMQSDFQAAHAHAPCILAIDELDSLPARSMRSERQEWWTPVINALLEHLNGVADQPGVAVIGICNDASGLDPALIRAGRLDRHIHVPAPGPLEIPGILRFLLDDKESRNLRDLARFSTLCFGMTGADLAKLLRDARRLARSAGRELREEDLVAVLEPSGRDEDDDRRVAIHEAGHALAAVRLGFAGHLNISILARSGVAGQTSIAAPAKILTRDTLLQTLTILLAGRASEEVMLGAASGGCGGGSSSDLAVATRLAINAIANLGLGDHPSLMWYGAADIDPAFFRFPDSVTAQVEALLACAYTTAKKLIECNRLEIIQIADALVDRRALNDDEIVSLASNKRRSSDDGLAGKLPASPQKNTHRLAT